jgi:hypothetical protein
MRGWGTSCLLCLTFIDRLRLPFQPRHQELALFMDFKADESYTPKHVSIRAGNSMQDVKVRDRDGYKADLLLALTPPPPPPSQEVRLVTLDEPSGWVHISLAPPANRCAACAAEQERNPESLV